MNSNLSKKQIRDIERAYAKRVTRWAANKAQAEGDVYRNQLHLWVRVTQDSWKKA